MWSDGMSMGLWSRDEIRDILLGIELAFQQDAGRYEDMESVAYAKGFRSALIAAAVSFGMYSIACDESARRRPAGPGASSWP